MTIISQITNHYSPINSIKCLNSIILRPTNLSYFLGFMVRNVKPHLFSNLMTIVYFCLNSDDFLVIDTLEKPFPAHHP